MADVQTENGYTRIANDILENIVKLPLSGTQFRIIGLLWRETYGFSRIECPLSLNYISKATGVSKRFISGELKRLSDANVIVISKAATFTEPQTLKFGKDFDKWDAVKLQQVNNGSTPDEKFHSTGERSFHSTDEGSFHQIKKYINKPLKKPPIVPQGDGGEKNQGESLKVQTAGGSGNQPVDHSTTLDERFAAFWKAYPRKVGKGAAEKSFKKIRPSESLLEAMLTAIERQKQSDQWRRDGCRYIPNPSTWLNQERWGDDLSESVQKDVKDYGNPERFSGEETDTPIWQKE